MQKLVGVNKFVERQTEDSPFSHFLGTFEALADCTADMFDRAKPGYKPGVVLVPMPSKWFMSGVVQVEEATELRAEFKARRPGEAPFISVLATGAKSPAVMVDVVLYSRETLGEEATTDCDWEIISINARTSTEEEPMPPLTMARNMLELPGGTKAEYTADQFARSIVYWSTRAMKG